jgi:DNA polymerase IV (DinB-like DNA polymerase)
MQLLSEFIGKQKIMFVGVGVSRLRERGQRQTLVADFG